MAEQLKMGWLSPGGDFFKCEHYEHTSVAEQIVDQFGYPSVRFQSADDELMAHGWVHISISHCPYSWHIIWGKFLTGPQKQFLRPYFEDSDIPVGDMAKMLWESEM